MPICPLELVSIEATVVLPVFVSEVPNIQVVSVPPPLVYLVVVTVQVFELSSLDLIVYVPLAFGKLNVLAPPVCHTPLELYTSNSSVHPLQSLSVIVTVNS